MARPKKNQADHKNNKIMVRFTDEEYDAITRDSENFFTPKATLIHDVYFLNAELISNFAVEQSAKLPQKIYDELKKMNTEIGHIGNNINQIARHLNQNLGWSNDLISNLNVCLFNLIELSEAGQELISDIGVESQKKK